MSGKELLAAINASLNGTSALLLIVSFILIKRRKVHAHAWTMIFALFLSAVFLTCYITSYVKYGETTTKYMTRIGNLRYVYLALLASHVLLAVVMLPMIWMAVARAYRRQWQRHHKIASPTFFIWFYVSVTGVVVYWMLYQLFPTM